MKEIVENDCRAVIKEKHMFRRGDVVCGELHLHDSAVFFTDACTECQCIEGMTSFLDGRISDLQSEIATLRTLKEKLENM